MSEIPMYPDECEHGSRDDTCKVCLLEDRVACLTILLRSIRKVPAGRVPQHLMVEIDILLGGEVQSP